MIESRTFVHEVQFYSDDAAFLKRLSRDLGADLCAGRGVIVVATELHRAGLAREFRLQGLDVEATRYVGRYVCLDAADTLRELCDSSGVVVERFKKAVGGLIDEISRRSPCPSVSVFGEMVALLMARRKRQEAMQLERLWNEVGAEHDFSLRCAYPLAAFRGPHGDGALLEACAEHTASYTN